MAWLQVRNLIGAVVSEFGFARAHKPGIESRDRDIRHSVFARICPFYPLILASYASAVAVSAMVVEEILCQRS